MYDLFSFILKLKGKANIVQRNKNSTLSTVDKVEIIPHNTQKEICPPN